VPADEGDVAAAAAAAARAAAVARISPLARSLLVELLARNPKKRLGSRANDPAGADVEAIKAHPFFAGVDWVALLERRVTPPWRPAAVAADSVLHFDRDFTSEPAHASSGTPAGRAAGARMLADGEGIAGASEGGSLGLTAPVEFEGFTYLSGNNLASGGRNSGAGGS
jgi:hypothetical protein